MARLSEKQIVILADKTEAALIQFKDLHRTVCFISELVKLNFH